MVVFCYVQVEHPCTEIIADVNLPAAQFQVRLMCVMSMNK